MSNNTGNVLLALLTGAAVGAGMGILFAPNKGTVTRKKIKEKALDVEHDLSDKLAHAKDDFSKVVNAKKAEFEQKVDDTVDIMSRKADDIINSLESKLEELKKKNAQLQK